MSHEHSTTADLQTSSNEQIAPQIAAPAPAVAPESPVADLPKPKPTESTPVPQTQISPASCGCGCGGAKAGPPQFVYALGVVNYDFINEVRRDSYQQLLGGKNPMDHAAMIEHLEHSLEDSPGLTWLLTQESTPIYALEPSGSFSEKCYQQLLDALRDQHQGTIERTSIPGTVVGSVTLMNGHTIPTVRPEPRGIFTWTTAALLEAVLGPRPEGEGEAEYDERAEGVRNFLERVYYEIRNFGRTSEERALNFVATNAFQAAEVYAKSLKADMVLDNFRVERSPLCPPGGDCWDVVLTFFDPEKRFVRARRVFRFGVNVSEVIPVTIGDVRSWYVH